GLPAPGGAAPRSQHVPGNPGGKRSGGFPLVCRDSLLRVATVESPPPAKQSRQRHALPCVGDSVIDPLLLNRRSVSAPFLPALLLASACFRRRGLPDMAIGSTREGCAGGKVLKCRAFRKPTG